ncbi:bifunctional [glutamate--ammonia ligase]-adenylyl-L-tyrosine phosphorylase/[glutamate--ammonia-ligase] adenylyltransferase [Tolumonas lignilytica]|uniref:bifunctional [glutamate--ammonia ligase]-adenylyl-L-tyrosine phosphorylase/[glutamate--ammonia-ligase] adenylyltransferase n=1 Tax=Tolumonas lignilytica TaxID=1283284 RepID=UPI0004637186|nr:bifunctional [glutamate--ammonia ligase]-adenylyl-L-tyrosine phosphorylase/[glutamate--ammonia-ligase] adenylyltransferase [Tolumonas lignilytica]
MTSSTVLPLPALLSELANRQWQRLLERADTTQQALFFAHQPMLLRLLALSDFVAEACIQSPAMLAEMLTNEHYLQAERSDSYAPLLQQALAEIENEEQLKRVLRQFRRQQMVLIAWRELLGLSTVQESFTHLSVLAESLIMAAYDWLYARMCREVGTPIGRDSHEPQRMLIFGMGKLGGGELNFSSDIDLIFAYPERGFTQGGRRELDNQSFFTRLGQQLIQALHQQTVDGQVYRVDMRLRPFGDSGPLVASFAALEDYYQQHGRNWERYAMVKARIMGPENADSRYLMQMLRPFIYRRYVDFGAIDALRKMKGMIVAEIRRKGLKNDIKLGAGGIRDVEFIVQAHQLIRGGREPGLQVRHMPAALAALRDYQVISTEEYQTLHEGYHYLRRVENILQEIADQQTQTLPDNDRDRWRVAVAMGHASWEDFNRELQQVHAQVNQLFREVIGEQEEQESDVPAWWQDVWHGHLSAADLTLLLQQQAITDAEKLATELVALRDECAHRPIGPQGREALAKLMPRLLNLLVQDEAPTALLIRIRQVLLQIATRSAYLQLLAENPGALKQLLKLCAATPLVAEQLARYPVLLDELLDPAQLYHPTPLEQYRDELRQYLLRVPEEDVEQQMEAMRQFKQIQLLKIVAADIVGALPLMKVSDHLTWLAEALLSEVINQAWNQLTGKHGVPPQTVQHGGKNFAVIAYGKLGGIELGYGSDLDVVFIHGGDHDDGYTNGDKPISVRQFYVRLAQKIIHLSETRTTSGILYEIDMELRPSGASGMLVSSLKAFEHYQQHDAWVWEHQALVRARAVYGDDLLLREFARVRAAVLSQHRDIAMLAQSVADMRAKMRTHLLRGTAEQFDLKQGAGGMIDIEFIAQFMVLAYAEQHPALLTHWSDNVHIFESCVAAGLLSEAEATTLKNAYLLIRDRAHRCTLSGLIRIIDGQELQAERTAVISLWHQLIESHLPAN